MKVRILIASTLLICGCAARAQQIGMDEWLNDGTEKQRIQRLAGIGVPFDMARLTVDSEASVEWLALRDHSSGKQAVLFLGCNGLSGAAVYLLSRSSNAWSVRDHLGLDCHYDDLTSVELAVIRDPESEELLVHHDCGDRGTGFYDQHFRIFAIAGNRFQHELDATEDLLDQGGAQDLKQRSTFTVVPMANSKQRTIEETRSSIVNGIRLRVERRYFYWSTQQGKYLPSAFTTVTAPAR